jgi:hypothetical protein
MDLTAAPWDEFSKVRTWKQVRLANSSDTRRRHGGNRHPCASMHSIWVLGTPLPAGAGSLGRLHRVLQEFYRICPNH